MRLTDDEIAQHLNALRIACDPASPFYRRVNFGHDGGLLTLPIPQQQQVFDAICPALMAMVEASGLPAIQRDDEGAILSASLEAIKEKQEAAQALRRELEQIAALAALGIARHDIVKQRRIMRRVAGERDLAPTDDADVIMRDGTHRVVPANLLRWRECHDQS
jgi:hypothetical protein